MMPKPEWPKFHAHALREVKNLKILQNAQSKSGTPFFPQKLFASGGGAKKASSINIIQTVITFPSTLAVPEAKSH